MKIDDKKLLDILIQGSYLSQEDATKAIEYSKKHHVTAAEYLVMEDMVTKDLLGQAIAESFKMPYADLKTHMPGKEMVEKIPEALAKKHHLLLVKDEDKQVTVGTDNPEQKGLLSALKKVFPKQKITIAYTLGEYIDAAFVHYRKSLDTRFAKIIQKQDHIAPEIVDEIIKDAMIYHAPIIPSLKQYL